MIKKHYAQPTISVVELDMAESSAKVVEMEMTPKLLDTVAMPVLTT